MDSIQGVEPLLQLLITLAGGLLTWAIIKMRANLASVQISLQKEQSERQRIVEESAMERQKLWANQSLNDRLIETLNRFSQSSDERDKAHTTAYKELTTAINALAIESRQYGTSHREVLSGINDNLKLQHDALKTIITGNGTIHEGVARLERGQNEAVSTITKAVNEVNVDIQKSITRLEDAIKSLQSEHKGNKQSLDSILSEMQHLKTIVSTPQLPIAEIAQEIKTNGKSE